eukprot:1072523-Pelagomonas_calceolata.AAC.1
MHCFWDKEGSAVTLLLSHPLGKEATEQPNRQAVMAESQHTRVISLIGDGSFQMTCQDVSTMLRYGLNPIIFLINNLSYTIERLTAQTETLLAPRKQEEGPLPKAIKEKGKECYNAIRRYQEKKGKPNG